MGAETIKIATTDDLPNNGSMKAFDFKDAGKVLLVKIDGEYFATSSKCSHYGLPLEKGRLQGSRIVCFAHGACFNAKTGDIEDAPAPQNLQKFAVEVKGSDIYVTADPELVKQSIRPTKPPAATIDSKKPGVVIIGGGSGALYAVEGLRESGYAGSIKIISKESYIPIDRTKLSKALIDDAAKLAVRDEAWYKDNKIDLTLGSIVKSVDVEKQTVTTDSGKTVQYEHLIMASGATPTRLPVDGVNLGNVFVLRTIDDTKAINGALASATTQQPEAVQKVEEKIGVDGAFKPNLVIVGTSFIGMEAALAGAKKANVTLVGMDKTPFESILGADIGKAFQKAHESAGIKFKLEATLSHFEPSSKDSSKVGQVVLKSGEKIQADVVILGAGVKPVTEYAHDIPGIQLHEKDKSIEVDDQLRVKGIGKKNVYAVGDIARYPDVKTGEVTRVEHWNVAGNHGRSVAATIVGKGKPFDKTAIFWSAQKAGQLRYTSTSKSSQYDQTHIDGSLDDAKFVCWYGKGDEIVALASMGRDPIVSYFSELLTLKKAPTFSAVKGGKDVLSIPLTA